MVVFKIPAACGSLQEWPCPLSPMLVGLLFGIAPKVSEIKLSFSLAAAD